MKPSPVQTPRPFYFVQTLSKAGNAPNAASRGAGVLNSANAAKKTRRALRFVLARAEK